MKIKYAHYSILLIMAILISLLGCEGKVTSTDLLSNENTNSGDITDVELTDKLVKKDGIYTYYQTASPHDSRTSLQTDGVKFFFINGADSYIERFKTHLNLFDKRYIMASFTANQDSESYYVSGKYDGKTHSDIIMKKSDGKNWSFGLLEGMPYIMPDTDWNNYIISMMDKAITLGAKTVSLEELSIFGDSGYEEAFKKEWKTYYKETWQDPMTNEETYFKAQMLRNYIMNRQAKDIFSAIKAKFPAIKTSIASHTSLAYFSFLNPFGNHDILALDVVDAIEGQTWSNTMELAFTYNGKTMARPFVSGYVDYSYWANLGLQFPEKEVSVITDPRGDGYENKSWADCEKLYKHQIVSQLMFPDIIKYNTVIWPQRAYGYEGNIRNSSDYKTVMNNIVSLQGQMYKYKDPIETNNRAVKVGALLLDTQVYQAGGPNNKNNNDSFYSMLSGLMYNGLLVDSIPAGEVDSKANILGNYDIIMVGYDIMKPQSKLVNENLKKYIENGGTVVYLGGQGDYENISSSWWKKAGFESPQDHLLSILGCGTSKRVKNIKSDSLTAESSSEIASKIGTIQDGLNNVNMIGYENVTGAKALYKADNKTIAFEKAVGKGNFVYFGIDPTYFSKTTESGNKLFEIVKEISKSKLSKDVISQKAISYKRGPVYGFNAIGGDGVTATGKYINMFDPKLSVIESLNVKNGESALLLDVSEKYKSSKPVVLYAQGNNPTIIENKTITRVVTAGPLDTIGTIRIFIPEGYNVSSVTAISDKKRDMFIDKVYDEATRSLLVTYKNQVVSVIIDVKY